jgi:hypothetical protein
MGEDLDAGGDVVGGGEFVRVMAEPVATTDEEHGDGADFRNDDAVVAGTAGEGEVGAGDGG